MNLIAFLSEHWRSGVEILLLTVLLYNAYLYFRATRGAKVLTGLAVVFISLTLLSQLLDLQVVGWLLKSLLAFFALALVVIFQPELRRGLAELGSQRWFSSEAQETDFVQNLAETALHLANRQVGALIAVERGTNLREDLQSGQEVDAIFSQALVETIFHPRTVLHDGGMIVHGGRIAACGCIFPVSQRENLDRTIGLRHRAGLGLAEETDAVVIVVSEETGAISLCCNGALERNLTPHVFKKRLGQLLFAEDPEAPHPQLGHETRLPGGGVHDLADHQEARERERRPA